jgi:hypothetical protein
MCALLLWQHVCTTAALLSLWTACTFKLCAAVSSRYCDGIPHYALHSASHYTHLLLSDRDIAILFCACTCMQDRERGETAFALHRAATSNGEIGRVRQIISASELISEVDLRVGLISGIPFSMQGTGV